MRLPSASIGFIITLFFSGCLYTSHNYHTGKILKPGQSSTSIGYGKQDILQLECNDENFNFSSYTDLEHDGDDFRCRRVNSTEESTDTSYFNPDVNRQSIPDWSFGYSLGIREKWGPFPGLEMGFLLEVPTFPISAEFYFRMGLPPLPIKKTSHSVALGYIMGAWADNSQYLGYAVSYELGKHLAYASFRTTYMATQFPDVYGDVDEDTFKFGHNRRFVHMLTLGFMWNIPKIVVFPDFVTPQVNFIYPDVPLIFDTDSYGYEEGGVYFKWNVGFGWRF